MFNLAYYIGVLIDLTLKLIGTSLSMGAVAIGYGASIGGTVGSIIAIFGLIYIAWQGEIIRRILWTILGRG